MEHDLAHALFAADKVLQGKQPHQDFFWHYGLLPLHGFAFFCGIFGETSVAAFQWHDRLLGILVGLLSLVLMMRVTGPLRGALIWLLTGFGWPVGGQVFFPYERVWLLLLALIWCPPDNQRFWRLSMAGVVLGLLQWVKFGTAFLAGFSWLMVDLIWLSATGRLASGWKEWFRQLALLLAVFLLSEGLRVAHAYATLPAELAFEAFIPVFHFEWYASYANDPTIRWPNFGDWGFFAGYQLPMLLGLVGGMAAAVWAIRSRWRSGVEKDSRILQALLPAVFLGLIYLQGFLFFFKHAPNMMVYGWLTLYGLAALLVLLPRVMPQLDALVPVLLLPCAAVVPLGVWRALTGNLRPSAVPLQSFAFPNGQSLWLSVGQGRGYLSVINRLEELSASATNQRGFLVIPMGSGLHFYGRVPMACRHSWFFTGAIRHFERADVLSQLLKARALVIHLPLEKASKIGSEPDSWSFDSWKPFHHQEEDKALLAALQAPEVLEDGWLIFPILPQTKPSQGP